MGDPEDSPFAGGRVGRSPLTGAALPITGALVSTMVGSED